MRVPGTTGRTSWRRVGRRGCLQRAAARRWAASISWSTTQASSTRPRSPTFPGGAVGGGDRPEPLGAVPTACRRRSRAWWRSRVGADHQHRLGARAGREARKSRPMWRPSTGLVGLTKVGGDRAGEHRRHGERDLPGMGADTPGAGADQPAGGGEREVLGGGGAGGWWRRSSRWRSSRRRRGSAAWRCSCARRRRGRSRGRRYRSMAAGCPLEPSGDGTALTVIVTGAAGFVGFHVATSLAGTGGACGGDRQPQCLLRPGVEAGAAGVAAGPGRGSRFHRVDIADKAAMFAVFDAAGDVRAGSCTWRRRRGCRHSMVDPWAYVSSNVMGQVTVLEAARRLPALASTWSMRVRPRSTAATPSCRSRRRTGWTRRYRCMRRRSGRTS